LDGGRRQALGSGDATFGPRRVRPPRSDGNARESLTARGGIPAMSSQTRARVMLLTAGVMLAAAVSAWSQPAPSAMGCCCVGYGGSYACAPRSQADCLAVQPAAPKFEKLADWKKAVDASKAQDAKPLLGGWIGESCEKAEARSGCCCF